MGKFKFITKAKISRLPKNPGVYAFDKGAKLLYIGKATNIRERVKNHFQRPNYRDNFFINQVSKIGFIKTNSEIEALILEANLIKKYQPKYNVVWRDDKNFFFVGITREDFPQIFWTHQPKSISNFKFQISNFIGPFVDGKALKQTLKVLRKVFPYKSCRVLPKRACLWYHLGRCPAPCLLKSALMEQIGRNQISTIQKESQKNVRNLMRILQGEKIQVLKNLKKEMREASKIQEFEKAAKIKNQITALEKVLAHAKIFDWLGEEYLLTRSWPNYRVWKDVGEKLRKVLKTKKEISRIEAYDVSNIQGQLATGAMVTFINGFSDKNFYRRFKIKMTGEPNDVAMIKEVLSRRLKHLEWPYPDLILIDGGRAQLNAGLKALKPVTYNLRPKLMALAKKENKLFIESQKPSTRAKLGAGLVPHRNKVSGAGKPILLKSLPREIFNLILQLRDEAHRFAISYHKKLREKAMFELED